MSKIIKITVLLLVINFTLNIENSSCQWVQVPNGMGNNKNVNSIAVSGVNIFAAAFSSGVYLSTNNGINWTQTSLNNYNAISLAVNSSYVFAGVDENCSNPSGVYRSDNNGLNWIHTTFIERFIPALATMGSNVFAGCWGCIYPGGVYLSTDNGSNWSQTSIINMDVCCLTVSENNIYAGIAYSPFSPGGVYLSTDNGTNWSSIGMNNKNALSIAVNGNNIFVGTYGAGIYLTTNNGVNWTQTSLNNQRVKSIVINENNIFAGTENNGIYLSTNNGTNWLQKNQGLDALDINSLLISNDYIFAGTAGKSVWRRNLSETIVIKQISGLVPSSYSLFQNYPNPFNSQTTIEFDIKKKGDYSLVIYDCLGRKREEVFNEYLSASSYNVSFNGDELQSGVYFYRLTADGKAVDTRKMVLVK